MAAPNRSQNPTVETKAELIEELALGAKPKSAWRIGTEHEKFGFRRDDLGPLPYDGPRGVEALLAGIRDTAGWDPVIEDGHLIALSCPSGASVTLEPGGQLELSGAPLESVHQTCDEVHAHLDLVRQVADPLDIGFLGIGFSPLWTLDETPVMPKARYGIMRRYMPTRGSHGLDMMFRTATVQVNLDFADEADMVRKFRTSLALQPIATALFANSPFAEGQPNGALSHRSAMWEDTDPDRCGMLPFVFEDGFGFERYVDYVLDVPMYFVKRDGRYIDAAGQSFRDFMAGRLPALPGEAPTLDDWKDHLTTVFPEVRLKRFLEMRGADGGPWKRLCALPAFWVGLLYDQGALDAAWDLVKDFTMAERQALRHRVPQTALNTEFRGKPLREMALRVLEIAKAGLTARNWVSRNGDLETVYLDALFQIALEGRTPAEHLLDAFHGPWNGDMAPLFREHQY